jgi:serine/threonine protein kinase
VQQVAEGGMGAVYQAVRDDDAFRKLVAVKILKRGMDTDYILRRFENEKQILAHFDHPYIARLLDAGITPDHRPFFVMEFYSGVPLDRYCQERRPSLEARIRLFQKICAAVEYAHENLIVHRDLKPGNILITADGEPRLLDFGIAKLMADDRQMTGLGVRVMTPGYASPEQIRGDAVTTASDIYSLGVLLYEVLTGRHPFPRRTEEPFISSALDLDKDPKAPSTLIRNSAPSTDSLPEGVSSARQWSHLLRGDLDRIVLKAMAAEPSRRYRTVDQLSADLGRFLDGLPVSCSSSPLARHWSRQAMKPERRAVRRLSLKGMHRSCGGWPSRSSSMYTMRLRTCPEQRRRARSCWRARQRLSITCRPMPRMIERRRSNLPTLTAASAPCMGRHRNRISAGRRMLSQISKRPPHFWKKRPRAVPGRRSWRL